MMRISCPFCGSRDLSEFTYLGDAALANRPTGNDIAAFHDYVYLRNNTAGSHVELWYHAAGCLSWLEAERDTRTHQFASVTLRGRQNV